MIKIQYISQKLIEWGIKSVILRLAMKPLQFLLQEIEGALLYIQKHLF